MVSGEEVVEIDSLGKELLTCVEAGECQDDPIRPSARFPEMKDAAQLVLYSMLEILALGDRFVHAAVFARLEVYPEERYLSRKLYLSPNAIVYKKLCLCVLSCDSGGETDSFSMSLLASVPDVLIEQGVKLRVKFLPKSRFGLSSLRIENVGERRPSIEDIANPDAFRKAVLTRLSSLRNEAFSRQVFTLEDEPNLKLGPSSTSWMSPSRSLKFTPQSGEQLLFQKLDEVGTSVKATSSYDTSRSNIVPVR